MINLDIGTYSNVIGIIFCDNAGELYTRQTGGFYIDFPKETGTFVSFVQTRQSIDDDVSKIRKRLFEMFWLHSKYGGRSGSIDEETAIELDQILKELLKTPQIDFAAVCSADVKKILVDRNLLDKKSQEAWVAVSVHLTDGSVRPAILTWPNSD